MPDCSACAKSSLKALWNSQLETSKGNSGNRNKTPKQICLSHFVDSCDPTTAVFWLHRRLSLVAQMGCSSWRSIVEPNHMLLRAVWGRSKGYWNSICYLVVSLLSSDQQIVVSLQHWVFLKYQEEPNSNGPILAKENIYLSVGQKNYEVW